MRELKFRVWEKNLKMMVIPEELIIKKNAKPTDEVMQYTGLKDKNGKEIYEGDIIKEHPNGHIGEVSVDSGNFGVEWDGDYPDWTWSEMACDQFDRIEVIGNIYENPGLMK